MNAIRDAGGLQCVERVLNFAAEFYDSGKRRFAGFQAWLGGEIDDGQILAKFGRRL
jgi:hypothetical protein